MGSPSLPIKRTGSIAGWNGLENICTSDCASIGQPLRRSCVPNQFCSSISQGVTLVTVAIGLPSTDGGAIEQGPCLRWPPRLVADFRIYCFSPARAVLDTGFPRHHPTSEILHIGEPR